MLTIGRFAQLSGLSVKALRHYDDMGLLAPAHVDPESGYRWYQVSAYDLTCRSAYDLTCRSVLGES